ncbi:MAG TPA: hypothetical protein VGE76_17460 [Opitutaceae bacterium]
MNPRPRNSLPALRRVPLALSLLMASTDLLARQAQAHRTARQPPPPPPAIPQDITKNNRPATPAP